MCNSVYMCKHIYTSVWRTEVDTQCLPQLLYFITLKQGLSLFLNLKLNDCHRDSFVFSLELQGLVHLLLLLNKSFEKLTQVLTFARQTLTYCPNSSDHDVKILIFTK